MIKICIYSPVYRVDKHTLIVFILAIVMVIEYKSTVKNKLDSTYSIRYFTGYQLMKKQLNFKKSSPTNLGAEV